MKAFGFVYIWFDRKRRKYCVGSHQGDPDDGYVTSTGWMMRAYRKRPEDFKRRIIAYCFIDDLKELRALEQRWLQMIKPCELGERYYNYKRVATGGNLYEGFSEARMKEVSKKLRDSRTGEKHHSARAVVIDDVRYATKAEAHRALGFDPSRRLHSKSEKYREYYFEDEGKLPLEDCRKYDEERKEVRKKHIEKLGKLNSERPKEWQKEKAHKAWKTRRERKLQKF
jgi:hypothetical protein